MRTLLTSALVMVLMATLVAPLATGQGSYVPATANTGGGGGGGYGYSGYPVQASTAAQGAMMGASDVIRAQGDAALNASAAAVNMTEARKNQIANYQYGTTTYFETRQINKQARAAERGKQPTEEDLVRMAQMGAPKRLRPSDLDPVSGRLNWPMVLTASDFTKQRAALDEAFSDRAARGGLSLDTFAKVRQTTEDMLASLKEHVRQIPTTQYMAAKRFLESLTYEAGLPTG